LIGDCLEFRPYPKTFKLNNEQFPFNDAYYIGIRIRGGVIPKKNIVDMTATRKLFFDKFREQLEVNPGVKQLLENKAIDMRIEYKSRTQLPDEVRPKSIPSASVKQDTAAQ